MAQQTYHIGDANKMMTAVEWLMEKYNSRQVYEESIWDEEFEQAKQMESSQIDSEYKKGWEAAEKSLSKEIEKIHEYYRSHRPT